MQIINNLSVEQIKDINAVRPVGPNACEVRFRSSGMWQRQAGSVSEVKQRLRARLKQAEASVTTPSIAAAPSGDSAYDEDKDVPPAGEAAESEGAE